MTGVSTTIALTNAAQMLTLAGDEAARAGAAMRELGILEHATLVIEDGRIAWVGTHAEFTAKLAAGELAAPQVTHDCSGALIMPALIDTHTHLVWAGHRRDELELRLGGADYEQIFAAGGGILSSVRQTRAASEQQLYEQSLARITRMRSCGATTFEIKSGYGLDLESELRQLRVARRLRDEAGFRIKATCLAAHAIPEEARGSDDARAAFIDRICTQILPAVVGEGLADYADVFCDRGAFTKAEARKVCEAALRLGLELRLHANEFGHTGGAELAAELRARSADHLLHLSDEERAALREAGVVATLLPGTSLVLGKPYANGRALIEAGVPIAVATDCNPGSCALENLAVVLALASYGCKLTPAEAVVATTHNAAASLGLASEVGRLAPGLSADLLVIASNDYRELVYHAGSPLIREVWSRGQRVDRAPV
ncbi:Imidazolonepropionase [Enhygromyxa salina]|uniref:Imidazolonepropionase n=1 Tax=Enhygromyxa salina TaxID=215803 RepID=A0A0C2CQG7_9BACT|nr:imidazolonepropionase [Enhygromyxa salina]KIG13436.1 Imidazolonepropionase [Enhygromyxa salina]